jgi:hypothetical protein
MLLKIAIHLIQKLTITFCLLLFCLVTISGISIKAEDTTTKTNTTKAKAQTGTLDAKQPDPCAGKGNKIVDYTLNSKTYKIDCQKRVDAGSPPFTTENDEAFTPKFQQYIDYLCGIAKNAQFTVTDSKAEDGKDLVIPCAKKTVPLRPELDPKAKEEMPEIFGSNLGRNFGCQIDKLDIKVEEIFDPRNFFPIYPENCTTYLGYAIPVSPNLIPHLMIRTFGAIASLSFYLLFPVLILSGLSYQFAGFLGDGLVQTIKRNIRGLMISLGSILCIYLVLGTLLAVINRPTKENPNDFIDLNLGNIFQADTK